MPHALRFASTILAVAAAAMPATAQTWRPDRLPPAPRPTWLTGFGVAVALAGEELFVGRTGEVATLPVPANRAGGVHHFRRGQDGSWAEAGVLTGSDSRLADGFGSAVVTDGRLLFVGAPKHDRGAVYVFERGGAGWAQTAKLAGPGAGQGDRFGRTLAFSNQVLLVGAPGADSARGAVYAFRRGPNGRWSEARRIAAGGTPGSFLGAAVALDGDRALVGAPGPRPIPGFGEVSMFGGPAPSPATGTVLVLRAGAGGEWTEETRLAPPPADTALGFGAAVYGAAGQAAIGAPITRQSSGGVYVFRRDASGVWTATGKIAPAQSSPMSAFGMVLAGTGGSLFVGAPAAMGLTGSVYVFAREESGWAEKQRLTTQRAGLGVLFGAGIAAAGETLVIGAPMAEFFEGKGHIYVRDAASGEWRDRGTIVDRPGSLPAITGAETRCAGGEAKGFKCEQVDLLSFLPVAALGGKRGIMLNDIWGWTDSQTNREYALVGRMDGTAFVDVTDPANPVYVGELPLHQGAQPNLWRDIKVYRDHAFIVSDGAGPHGIQVFDLTELRGVRAPPVTFQETAHYAGIHSAHNIAINEETGFAYPIGNSMGGETCGGALHMVDIRDPRNPKFAGCYADPATGNARTGYTHDAQCVVYKGPDERYKGREICFNASETAVGIADVTDKTAPKPIAVAAYPNTNYAHQGWLSDDQRYFFLDDEGDELAGVVPRTRTIIWDVTRLDEPVLLTEFLGTTAATDHNLYVRGRYMFQSNYVSGLRVIDIADPKAPKEVGYFDTVPFGENVPGFAGSWSNFPYFPSGTIVVTSMREGLFVLRHRPVAPIP